MKKFITTLLIFCVSLSYAQYSHYFTGYKRYEEPHEIQFVFIPLSISNNQEVNMFELGWRRGANSLSIRYGVDNSRTHYYDINTQAYFWITKHIDLTCGAGFGTRTNLDFETERNTDKYYIPYNAGIIIKPSKNFQIITKIEKLDFEHDYYWQTGVLIKFPISKN